MWEELKILDDRKVWVVSFGYVALFEEVGKRYTPAKPFWNSWASTPRITLFFDKFGRVSHVWMRSKTFSVRWSEWQVAEIEYSCAV
jgi:hypothetical protein